MTRINQYPFEVRGIDSLFEQSFPYAFISPSTKPPMSILPVSIVRREVSPWSSCAKDPEDSVNEQAVVCSWGGQQNLSFPVDAELTMPMLDLKDHVYDVMSYPFLFLAFKETKHNIKS